MEHGFVKPEAELLTEFHEAGLWLPEEIEAREQQREADERRAKFFAAQIQAQAGMILRLRANQLSGQLGQQGFNSQFLGQRLGGARGSSIGSALGDLFRGIR